MSFPQVFSGNPGNGGGFPIKAFGNDKMGSAGRLYRIFTFRLKQVLDIMENEFGNDHLKILPILESLAGCYWKMCKNDKARELEERALRIRLKWIPTNSTQTLI